MTPKTTGPGEPVTSNGSGPDKFPPTLESRPGLERLHRAVYMLTAAERRLVWKYKSSGEPMSPARLRALVFLASEKEVKHGTLAREAELNPASVTAMVEQLEVQRLVRRRRDTNDRRVWWISLTAKGRREVGKLQAEWDRYFAEAFAGTPARDLETAADVIEQLAEIFGSAGGA